VNDGHEIRRDKAVSDQTTATIQGTERTELLVALLKFCECDRDADGVLVALCPGHLELVEDDKRADERWLRRLHFVRGLRRQLWDEEWIVGGVAA
jgi:hypothetical protein